MRRLDLKSIWHKKNFSILLIIFFLTFMIVGVLIVRDFGVSWDEQGTSKYGEFSLSSYSKQLYPWGWFGVRKYYGPAFVMFQSLVGSALDDLLSEWTLVDARHFVNYTSFLVGALALNYILCQFVTKRAALFTTLLFLTQPLFFGHAFINDKDIPFMSMFLVSIACGLYAISKYSAAKDASDESRVEFLSQKTHFEGFIQELSAASKRTKALIFILAAAIIFMYLELFILKILILPTIQRTVVNAFYGNSFEAINSWFISSAQFAETIPVTKYVEKATKLYRMIRGWILVPGFLIFSLLFLSISKQTVSRQYHERVLSTIKVWHKSRYLYILLVSGATVGITTAMRVFGLFAGALVSFAYLGRYKLKSFASVLVYWISALLALFALWPFLWGDPIDRFIKSLFFMIYHPWRGYVLYGGLPIKGRLLPWHYLPFLMTIQFTLPVIILAVLGTVLLIIRSKSKPPSLYWRIILGIWIVLPLLIQIVRDPWLYDNFRQFFFVTPVLFILGAFAIEFVINRLKGTLAQVFFAILIIFPGVVSLIRLHPYQYVYYNEIVGGVKGASRQYELDYWCIAYKEATEFANDNFEEESVLAYWGTVFSAKIYVEDHLRVGRFNNSSQLENLSADYVVICTRANVDQNILPEAEVIHEVQIDGVPLVVIKKINNSE